MGQACAPGTLSSNAWATRVKPEKRPGVRAVGTVKRRKRGERGINHQIVRKQPKAQVVPLN